MVPRGRRPTFLPSQSETHRRRMNPRRGVMLAYSKDTERALAQSDQLRMPTSRRPNSIQPAFGDPKSGVRLSVDALVQGTLVELFNTYGVAFAPMPRSSLALGVLPDVSVAASFVAGGNAGRLTLSMPAELLEHMKPGEATTVRMDWARELCNQLMGRIKNRLLPFGARLELGLLTLLESKLLRHQLQETAGLRLYLGRTLRGPVLVSARGLPADAALSYVGSPGATEGTLLWL